MNTGKKICEKKMVQNTAEVKRSVLHFQPVITKKYVDCERTSQPSCKVEVTPQRQWSARLFTAATHRVNAGTTSATLPQH